MQLTINKIKVNHLKFIAKGITIMDNYSIAVAFRTPNGGTHNLTFFGKTLDEARFNAEMFCVNHPNMKRVL